MVGLQCANNTLLGGGSEGESETESIDSVNFRVRRASMSSAYLFANQAMGKGLFDDEVVRTVCYKLIHRHQIVRCQDHVLGKR